MDSKSVIRRFDHLGRVLIPKKVRDSHGWEAGSPLEMRIEENRIVLQPCDEEKIQTKEG